MKEFDFGGANEKQKEAIQTLDGPVCILAGPGTGKTFTLVQRVKYLIESRGVEPEEILIATFTEKAAKELITRITNELSDYDKPFNVNDMYIGTFHSICLRIIQDHLEYTKLKKNYRLMDDFDQKYLVFRNKKKFNSIDNIEVVKPEKEKNSWLWSWKAAGNVCNYVNNISEELVDPEQLRQSQNKDIRTIADVMDVYHDIVEKENKLDFSSIQTECYRMLTDKDHPEVLNELRDTIRYIMVDEYQDTNYIQEQLIFLLAGDRKNICVVGDDDQGLYRFRGATIRNILEFSDHFAQDECREIVLDTNYRSDGQIIDFYNKWMQSASDGGYGPDWGKFRKSKSIKKAAGRPNMDSPTVVKLTGRNEEEWHEKVYSLIKELHDSGKVTDYNQIAFLFGTVRYFEAPGLAEYLESKGIDVYSPRSDMFFDREEIRRSVGLLLILFEEYDDRSWEKVWKYRDYCNECIEEARKVLKEPGNKALKNFVDQRKYELSNYTTHNYSYASLLYQMYSLSPFNEILNRDVSAGVIDTRAERNLARFTGVIGKFEDLYNIDVLTADYLKNDTYQLINVYLKQLFATGIDEYEDETEYAPSGCISFLTIHQAKGMEFPIVFVDSLGKEPNPPEKTLMDQIEEKYFPRQTFEPSDKKNTFDFWRLYYTAFSRAQDLLILTCQGAEGKCFEKPLDDLEDADRLNPDAFSFSQVKQTDLKDIYSFTSHILMYENCPKQYKFYKELQFMPVRHGAMLFGTLVHETIEDIHKAAMRGEADTIDDTRIEQWFNSNYASLSQSTHQYLRKEQLSNALDEVKAYADRQSGKWDQIAQAEVDVSLIRDKYILDGKIDLIKGKNDTVEIVDFKSEQKPDQTQGNERLEQYKRQLEVYAYLVEQKTGKKVSGMKLYYTGDKSDDPEISFPYDKNAIAGTINDFDNTVDHIQACDFDHDAIDKKSCSNCDFRYYCGKIDMNVYGLCPDCGRPLRKRKGKYGEFIGCSGYPECKYTRNV